MHLQRRPGILCSNDAKSCYDCILHAIASLALQRLGMPIQPINCMLVTIQEFKHHIRTAHGTSESALENDSNISFQGICQGNGAGPTIWVAVSAPLIEMMRNAGHGITYKAPLSHAKDHLVGFAFVDDTDIVQGDLTATDLSIEDIYTCMQEGINRWEGGLKATGGAICPDKSFVYPIAFTWDDTGEYTFLSPNEINIPLTVKDDKEVRHALEQVLSSEGRETLGVYLAPNGTMTEQIQAMKKKVQKWCANISAGRLPPREAWQCVSTTIMKSLQYPLPALTLS